MSSNNFLIRADASGDIGTGHIMRMLAFGQQLIAAGQTVHFVTIPYDQGVVQRLRSEGFTLHLGKKRTPWNAADDLELVIAVAISISAKWIILDGYQYDTTYQETIKSRGFKLLCVDDLAACAFAADAVLNQNFYAQAERYDSNKETALFLGPGFALLRKEFFDARPAFKRNVPATAGKILITLGGGDPDNITGKVLSALDDARMQSVSVRVVIGSLNPHHEKIRRYAQNSPYNIEVLYNVTTQMPELFKWADLGITAAGSTTLEALFMGLPCFVISIASNQEGVLNALKKEKLAFDFDRVALADGSFKNLFFKVLLDENRRRACVSRLKEIDIGGQVHEVVAKMTCGLEVRFINRDYIKANIETFCRLSAGFSYSPWQASNFLMELPDKWEYSAVALKNGRIAGFAINSLKEQSIVYTHLFMVAERYRGSRIGTFLARSIAAKAKRTAARSLMLRCPVDNISAVAFYKSLGFATIEVIDDELSHPSQDYLLAKEL